jgi:hypothetical protein
MELGNDFLTLRIGGKPGLPERLLLISRPEAGRVVVREWTSDSWNTPGQNREQDASTLLAQIESALASGQTVNHEMYGVRQWLGGQGSGVRG